MPSTPPLTAPSPLADALDELAAYTAELDDDARAFLAAALDQDDAGDPAHLTN